MKNIKVALISIFVVLGLLTCSSGFPAACDKGEFTVAIDAGHTKNQPGTTSSRGISEFYFNKKVAQLLLKELLEYGFNKAFLTNEQGDNISLADRTDIANANKARLLLTIHHDSTQPHYLSPWNYKGKQLSYSDEFSGYSLFYSKKNRQPEKSLKLARLIGSELRSNLFVPTLHHAEMIKGENRKLIDKEKGIYEFDDLVVLKKAGMPAVLVECGIIVNRSEEILLGNPVYQRAIVLSLRNAIEKFCEEERESK